MIRFWYDMTVLDYRYMEAFESYNGEMQVLANDGTIHSMPRGAAVEVEKFSRIVRDPQGLLDALIANGFKPNKIEGTPGHVEALNKHIAFAESVVRKVLK